MSFITSNEAGIYYECGYSCDNALLLVFDNEHKVFITDGRYKQEAKTLSNNNPNIQTIITPLLIDSAIEIIKQNKKYLKKGLFYDPSDISIKLYKSLKDVIRLKPKNNLLHFKRIIKTNQEIRHLSLAAKKARKAFTKFENFLEKSFKSNKTPKEYELNFKAKKYLSNNGKYSLSFEPITAIQENSAKPHAVCTSKKLNKNDLILFDGGIKYNNYCSDKTITIINKKNKNYKLQKKVYDIVQKAQDEAFKTARAGVKACKVDKKAREVIDKAGFLKYFTHSTGHGVGLDIHELPYISKSSDIVLQENMVFTIEPGIYIPGEFGVRIEETFYIKDSKATRI